MQWKYLVNVRKFNENSSSPKAFVLCCKEKKGESRRNKDIRWFSCHGHTWFGPLEQMTAQNSWSYWALEKQPNQVQVGVSPAPDLYSIHYGPSLSSTVLTPRACRLAATLRGQCLRILCAPHVCCPPYHLHSKSMFSTQRAWKSYLWYKNSQILNIHDVLYFVLYSLHSNYYYKTF